MAFSAALVRGVLARVRHCFLAHRAGHSSLSLAVCCCRSSVVFDRRLDVADVERHWELGRDVRLCHRLPAAAEAVLRLVANRRASRAFAGRFDLSIFTVGIPCPSYLLCKT